LIGGQLGKVFNDPDFRQLEAAWRGLHFLVDRLNFRENTLLDVLAAPKAEIDNALYHQVLIPEHNAEGEQPALSAVLLDVAFDNSTADLALLGDLADTGASLQAPIIASVAPAFFGVEKQTDLPALPVLWQHLDTAEYIAWHKLRENKASNYLVLALPDFLLRYAYDAEDHRAKGFTFVEEGQLWGRASLAVGVRIAESFVQTGWPSNILGTTQARVEDLPVWYSPQGHTPLGCLMPDSKFGEFKKEGFTVLAGSKDRDYLFLARANTVCKPETYDDLMAAAEAREHVTLASQLFVTRAAHHVLSIQPDIEPNDNLEAVMREIDAQMRAFLYSPGKSVPPEAVWVEHVPDSGLPNQELFAIRLMPPAYVLTPSLSLILGIQVPKQGAAA
jgi:type VI secretion system protein ImpC